MILKEVAERLAEASGIKLEWFFAKTPSTDEWYFDDVLETLPPLDTDPNTKTVHAIIRIDVPRTPNEVDGSEISALVDKFIDIGMSDAQDTVDNPDLSEKDQAILATSCTFHEAGCV